MLIKFKYWMYLFGLGVWGLGYYLYEYNQKVHDAFIIFVLIGLSYIFIGMNSVDRNKKEINEETELPPLFENSP